MVDIVDPARRSKMMSKIRSKNTKPELTLRRALHARGYRYQLHRRDLPGSPDLVFPKYRSIVFVHGCFWHRHVGCTKATLPKTRIEFWEKKFDDNLERDRRTLVQLRKAEWQTLVVWECELAKVSIAVTVDRVAKWLDGNLATHTTSGLTNTIP